MTDDAFDRTMRHHDVRELACKRIALFGDEDLREWDREMRVSDGEFGSEYDSLAYHCDTALMALEPMPDFRREDHQ